MQVPRAQYGQPHIWRMRPLEPLRRFVYRSNEIPLLAAVAVVFGGLLRLHHFDRLSLWLDEGFTVYFSRLSWLDVLGIHGQYDPHPPLYYSLVKLVSIAVPDLQAGRLLSVLTGTATIAVLYFLVARLMHRQAGLLAAFLLAVSPLHVWYSQEARQYAPMTLAVAFAYLSLVEINRRPGWGWAIAFGLSTLVAVYIDYSAIFALIPAAPIALWVIYRHRRLAIPLVAAGFGSVSGFLPWAPQARASAEGEGADRAWYLGVSIERVERSLVSVAGFNGRGLYYWGDAAPWERWPALHLAFIAILVGIAACGLVSLGRHARISVAVVAGLAGGTVLAAAGLSLLSPAYAERTILPAVLGWCALAACAPFISEHRYARTLSGLLVALWLGLSLVTLSAVKGGDKQHWDALAADADRAAGFGWPVVMAPAVTETLVELYGPGVRVADQLTMGGYSGIPPDASELIRTADALWFVSVESPESRFALDQFRAEGFEAVPVRRHRDRLQLQLLVRSELLPGGEKLVAPLDVESGEDSGWNSRVDGGWIGPAGDGISIVRDMDGESSITTVIEVDAGLGLFVIEARSDLSSGNVRAFLICQDSEGTWSYVAPDGAGATIPNDDAWHTIRVASFCPPGTTHARLDLRNAGIGVTEFRNAQLFWVPAPRVTPE